MRKKRRDLGANKEEKQKIYMTLKMTKEHGKLDAWGKKKKLRENHKATQKEKKMFKKNKTEIREIFSAFSSLTLRMSKGVVTCYNGYFSSVKRVEIAKLW